MKVFGCVEPPLANLALYILGGRLETTGPGLSSLSGQSSRHMLIKFGSCQKSVFELYDNLKQR